MNIYTDFLSREELLFLTGRKQQAKMIEQLNEMGIPFVTNAHGTPIVRRDYAAPRPRKNMPANDDDWISNEIKAS
jgi:hypothetical protein